MAIEKALLSVHYHALKSRKTPYAIELKDKIEERLKEIAYSNRDETEILEEMRLELADEESEFATKLILEIEEILEELNPNYFAFPSTEAEVSFEYSEVSNYRKKASLLSLMGYETGQKAQKKGLNDNRRKVILDNIYFSEIPKDIASYVEDIKEWGNGKSCSRLKKMAYIIASVVKDKKRSRTIDYSDSINQRETDLAYLKKEYYDNSKCASKWIFPDTEV